MGDLRTATRWASGGVVLLLAVLVGAAGIATLPPDDHEVLVLQTAREMAARDDWVVPWFNGAPRLNKPPMNYWLTGLVAHLDPVSALAPWHGRVPSLLAGLASAVLILGVGARLYDRRSAVAGAALFVTCAGFFTYAHDARPDMLYAALCWAGLACFALAATRRSHAAAPMVAMWICYALAILTKGPQVPVMFLAASAVFLSVVQGFGVAGIARLRPLAGLLLVGAIALPWWWLLGERLPPQAVQDSQLGGSLLRLDPARLLNGYYFYRPLQLVLPWLPLVPLAWAVALSAKEEPGREASLLLACVLGVTALAFSLGAQQRFFYLLPVLPVMCLLAGRGVCRILDGRSRAWQFAWWLQAVLVAAAVVWLFADHERVAVGFAVALGAVAAGALLTRAGASLRAAAGVAAVIAVAATFSTFATSDRFWSEDRRSKHELGRAIAARVDSAAPLVSLRLTPAVYVWETARPIPRLDSEAALERATDGETLYVIAPVAHMQRLRGSLDFEEVVAMPAGAPDRAALYRIFIHKGGRQGREGSDADS